MFVAWSFGAMKPHSSALDRGGRTGSLAVSQSMRKTMPLAGRIGAFTIRHADAPIDAALLVTGAILGDPPRERSALGRRR
jgi:hypothetical protein